VDSALLCEASGGTLFQDGGRVRSIAIFRYDRALDIGWCVWGGMFGLARAFFGVVIREEEREWLLAGGAEPLPPFVIMVGRVHDDTPPAAVALRCTPDMSGS